MDDGIRLPGEVFAHIFSFLDPKDKLKASSVCQRWMKVFNEYPDLLEEVCVRVIPNTIEDISKPSFTMTRKFSFFMFKYVDIDEECFLFLQRFGPHFRRLIFVNCQVRLDVDQPLQKIQTCEKLLKLKILRCGLWDVLGMFYHLPALKTFCFKVIRFSKREIVRMQQTIPLSLTELRLSEINPTKMDQKSVVYEGVLDFILNRRFSLESLDLLGVNFQDFVMDRLSQIEGSSLKRLQVLSNFLKRNCIESFCNHHRRIVALNIRDSTIAVISFRLTNSIPKVTDSTVVAICISLPLLEELDISCCIGVNESVAMIFKLKRLKRLNLNGCNRITKASFINALNGLACKNLNFIDLRGTLIDRIFLSSFLPLVPNLREITLSHSHYLNSQWVERLPRCYGVEMTFVPRST